MYKEDYNSGTAPAYAKSDYVGEAARHLVETRKREAAEKFVAEVDAVYSTVEPGVVIRAGETNHVFVVGEDGSWWCGHSDYDLVTLSALLDYYKLTAADLRGYWPSDLSN